ncbi:serine/threonine-protein kinase [Actinacidiphila glaucinigra]|uniref:non-specific serine/threonine protein kinase n=1 Tax=Actinacidiphila glaucinigra TaxID=235986 RepID=A0A239NJX2_9ACTN|nr:serine/threonine-protein kinase [Actinacidiphila glaucinigra]SNT54429.1 serine/threonine protein kinase [Actinacidiphila glaucinigra]
MRPVGSRYELVEPLGRGATGTVWRSQVRDTGETVAIKVLKEELASDPDIVMRFLRERSVLLRLRHPHIVRVRDLVVEGELLALVMDLIEGPDLYRHLRENGPFTPVGAALLTAAVADALAASHADGVVHRDLKPANVLLATVAGPDGTQQMHPMLTDFGIARLADSPGVTRTHEFVGTPAYIAPESAQGRPQTSAVDIYGAGILLYELVTGRPPFRGESALEVLHQHLSEEPRRPSTVPEPLWTVIERCLRKEPGERPSAENLARALRVVAAGVGVHSSPAQSEAALGVAALLAPDPSPATVPDTPLVPPDAADPTQVLPNRSPVGGYDPYDPNAATSVLPASAAGAADATRVIPGGSASAGAGDGTRVMPPVPGGPPDSGAPQGPHPWESQLNRARARAEQTEIQYLDPEQDPLRRRPRRQASQQPQSQQPPQSPQGYQQQRPQQPQYRQPAQPGYAPQPHPQQYAQRPPQPQPQQYAPRPQQQPAPRYEQPQHQRYEPQRPSAPEPAPYREPRQRSANPMKIPGLGCLKGCFTMIIVLIVIVLLVWYLTPVPEWLDTGKSLWGTVSDGVGDFWDWVSGLGGSSGGSGTSGGTP